MQADVHNYNMLLRALAVLVASDHGIANVRIAHRSVTEEQQPEEEFQESSNCIVSNSEEYRLVSNSEEESSTLLVSKEQVPQQ